MAKLADKILNYSLAVFIGLIIAFGLSQVSIFGLMFFGGFLALLFLILAATVVFDIFYKKNFSKYVLVMLGICIIAGVVGLSLRSHRMTKNEKTAELIVQDLNQFFQKNDSLPNSLIDLNAEYSIKFIKYSKKDNNYNLWYSVDGWHYCSYTSVDREWHCGD